MIWIADAHRSDGKRSVVDADEKLTEFLELKSAIHSAQPVGFIDCLGDPDVICAPRRRAEQQTSREICCHMATENKTRPHHSRRSQDPGKNRNFIRPEQRSCERGKCGVKGDLHPSGNEQCYDNKRSGQCQTQRHVWSAR
jgi:hypothetical protein